MDGRHCPAPVRRIEHTSVEQRRHRTPEPSPPRPSSRRPMITRIWHGWTTLTNADRYEQLLRAEIFTGIVGREIPGFRDIQLLRRPVGSEVEFVTIMRFDSLDAVRTFAGSDYEVAVVPDAARALLAR